MPMLGQFSAGTQALSAKLRVQTPSPDLRSAPGGGAVGFHPSSCPLPFRFTSGVLHVESMATS